VLPTQYVKLVFDPTRNTDTWGPSSNSVLVTNNFLLFYLSDVLRGKKKTVAISRLAEAGTSISSPWLSALAT
jgi:hypothetical protein